MARQAILFGFGSPIYVNETGTRQAILPTAFLNETVTVVPPSPPPPPPSPPSAAGSVGGGRRRERLAKEPAPPHRHRETIPAPREEPAPKRKPARRIVAVPPEDEPAAPGTDAGPLIEAADRLVAERLAEQDRLAQALAQAQAEQEAADAAEEEAIAMILIAAGT